MSLSLLQFCLLFWHWTKINVLSTFHKHSIYNRICYEECMSFYISEYGIQPKYPCVYNIFKNQFNIIWKSMRCFLRHQVTNNTPNWAKLTRRMYTFYLKITMKLVLWFKNFIFICVNYFGFFGIIFICFVFQSSLHFYYF